MIDCTEVARAWFDQGFMPLPLCPDGSKSPAVDRWRPWHNYRPDWRTVSNLFSEVDHDGLGLITGKASGNLEMVELEGRAVAEELLNRLAAKMTERGEAELWHAISTGYVEFTPSGGLHYYYRVTEGEPRPSTKLARRPATQAELIENPDDKIKVLIETRGQGGFTVIAPSAGRSHKSEKPWQAIKGDPSTVPTITGAQRDLLYAIATELDEMPPKDEPSPPGSTGSVRNGQSDRPGDDFNARADWAEILGQHGWRLFKQIGNARYWERPGKRHRGVSATTGRDELDRLYVFSTSTEFDTEIPYQKWAAYAILNHGGDYSAAASDLRRQGYGKPTEVVAGLTWAGPSSEAGTDAAADEGCSEPIDQDQFWSARPELAHVRQWAWAKGASGWTTLGCVLINVLAAVPPSVQLPPTIGGPAALNLNIVLVGESGQGKGLAPDIADALLSINSDTRRAVRPIGSGEGMTRAFGKLDNKGRVWTQELDSIIFEIDEIDTLAALARRQGGTIGPMIKTGFMGNRVFGFTNGEPSRNFFMPPFSYRLCLRVGMQPTKGDILLGDSDGGTPQRFLWMDAIDRAAVKSDRPGNRWELDLASKINPGQLMLPAGVAEMIQEDQLAKVRGARLTDALDGHRIMLKLRVAAALMYLRGGSGMITAEDWELAEMVLKVSDACRASVGETVERKRTKIEDERDARLIKRAVATEEALIDTRRAGFVNRITTKLGKAPDRELFRRELIHDGFESSDRPEAGAALDWMEASGLVELSDRGNRQIAVRLVSR